LGHTAITRVIAEPKDVRANCPEQATPKRQSAASAKKPDRASAQYTARPGFFRFRHLNTFERPTFFDFPNNQ
jgi:hypothetical protein